MSWDDRYKDEYKLRAERRELRDASPFSGTFSQRCDREDRLREIDREFSRREDEAREKEEAERQARADAATERRRAEEEARWEEARAEEAQRDELRQQEEEQARFDDEQRKTEGLP